MTVEVAITIQVSNQLQTANACLKLSVHVSVSFVLLSVWVFCTIVQRQENQEVKWLMLIVIRNNNLLGPGHDSQGSAEEGTSA